MKVREYVDEILLKLGSPIVEVEIDQVLDKVVKSAFREIKRYVNTSEVKTIPYSNSIDLTPYKVQSIQYVMRATRAQDTQSNMIDAFYLSQNSLNSMADMTDYRRYLLVKQVKNTMRTDLDYTHVGNTLYISCTYPYPTLITICYTPTYDSVEDINDPYWEDIIMRMSLALAKVTLGRVRGKYKLNTSVYELDGDTLVQEGNQELTDLRQFLVDNFDLTIPLD